MKIIIIGGSIGGLSTGIALHCKGQNVEIYERSTDRMQDRGARLVIQQDMVILSARISYFDKRSIWHSS